jgi:hypothetical protein
VELALDVAHIHDTWIMNDQRGASDDLTSASDSGETVMRAKVCCQDDQSSRQRFGNKSPSCVLSEVIRLCYFRRGLVSL